MIRLLALLLLWPALAWAGPPPSDWQSRLAIDHPLVGRVWSVTDGQFISTETLRDRLAAARFVLLGEKHDNPDDHRLQAWALDAMVAAGRRPAVVWEMLTADQAPALAAYLAAPGATAKGLGPAVGWAESGWPDWNLYEPIAAVALRAGLRMAAGNLGVAEKRLVLDGGLEALPATRRKKLALGPWGAALEAALVDDLYESHCRLMGRELMAPLVAIQRLRDARLADALLTAGRDDGAVLIAGAGHVRRDRGVPWYLTARQVPGKVLVLVFREVSDDETDPAAYVDPGVADFVWFTPRVDDRDHCAELAKRFGKHHSAALPDVRRRRPGRRQ